MSFILLIDSLAISFSELEPEIEYLNERKKERKKNNLFHKFLWKKTNSTILTGFGSNTWLYAGHHAQKPPKIIT